MQNCKIKNIKLAISYESGLLPLYVTGWEADLEFPSPSNEWEGLLFSVISLASSLTPEGEVVTNFWVNVVMCSVTETGNRKRES